MIRNALGSSTPFPLVFASLFNLAWYWLIVTTSFIVSVAFWEYFRFQQALPLDFYLNSDYIYATIPFPTMLSNTLIVAFAFWFVSFFSDVLAALPDSSDPRPPAVAVSNSPTEA